MAVTSADVVRGLASTILDAACTQLTPELAAQARLGGGPWFLLGWTTHAGSGLGGVVVRVCARVPGRRGGCSAYLGCLPRIGTRLVVKESMLRVAEELRWGTDDGARAAEDACRACQAVPPAGDAMLTVGCWWWCRTRLPRGEGFPWP